jgi:hypothetical protein
MRAGVFIRSICAGFVACALWQAAPGFHAEGTEKPPMPQGMQGHPGTTAPGAGAAARAFMQPMDLTDDKLKGFLDAMDELKTLGDKASALSATNPTRPQAFAGGMHFSTASTDIIKKHGFTDPAEFQRVAYNAALAYNVLQSGGKEAMKKKMDEADAKRAEAIEKLRQHLTPEQLEMLKTQINSGLAVGRSMANVSDQNLELVKKYGTRMDALSKR